MPGKHSGLHNLKRKKNLLAKQLHRFNNMAVIPDDDRPAFQATLARTKQTYRAMHLADCYMRGRPYGLCEPVKKTSPVWELVAHFIDQHGGPIVVMPSVDEWALSNA